MNAYDTEQNRLNALQLTGIDFEAKGWQTRLDGLGNFVKSYGAKQGELASLQAQLNKAQDALNKAQESVNNAQTSLGKAQASVSDVKWHVIDKSSGKEYWSGDDEGGADQYIGTSKRYGVSGYANMVKKKYNVGVASVGDNELAWTSDPATNPNAEIAVGKSLNNSTLTSLKKGGGVINATSSRTFAGLINSLGNNSLGSMLGMNTISGGNSSNSTSTNFSIANVNVTANDANGFIESLKDFALGMTQKGYSKV